MDNTVVLLGGINTSLKAILGVMQAQDAPGAKDAKKVSDLHGTGLKSSPAINKEKQEAADGAGSNAQTKKDLKDASISDIVKLLQQLPAAVKSLADIKSKDVKKFEKTMSSLVKVLDNVDKKFGKGNSKSRKATAELLVALQSTGKIIKDLAKVSIIAPIAWIGAKMVVPIMGALAKAMMKVTTLKGLGNANRALKAMHQGVRNIILVAVAGVAMVAALALTGIIVKKYWDLVLFGLGGVAVVVLGVALVTMLVSMISKKIAMSQKDFMTIATVAVFGIVLVLACALLGLLIKQAWDFVLLGFTGIAVTLFGIALVTMIVGKIAKKTPKFAMDVLAVGGMLILAATIVGMSALMGMLIKKRWKDVIYGFTAIAITLILVAGITWLVGKIVGGKSMKTAAANILMIEGLMVVSGILLLGAMALSNVVKKYFANPIEASIKLVLTFGLITSILLLSAGIAYLAGKVAGKAKKGIINILLVEAMIGVAMLLTFGLLLLSKKAKGKWKDIYATLAGIGGILVAAIALAAIVGIPAVAALVAVGTAVLILVEVMLGLAILVTLGLIGLHNVMTSSGVTWQALMADVTGLCDILMQTAAVATVASLISPLIALGTVALALVVVLLGLSLLVGLGLVGYHCVLTAAGVTSDQLLDDTKGLALILGAFALVAAAAGLLIVPIAIGMVGMTLLFPFAAMALLLADATANVSKKIRELGGIDSLVRTVTDDLPRLMHAFSTDNLQLGFGDIVELLMLGTMYDQVGWLAGKIVKVTDAIGKLAQIGGLITEDGRLRPVLGIDNGGNVRYGDPVDVKLIAKTVGATVKEFVAQCNYGFKDVIKMIYAAKIYEMVGKCVDPIAKFVKMITGYTSHEPGTLTPVYINDKGELVESKVKCNVRDVASHIVSAVSTFLEEIYSEDNITRWVECTQGKRNGQLVMDGLVLESLSVDTNQTGAVKKVGNILALLVSPISQFIDLLCGLGTTTEGKLRKVTINSDGKIVYGPEIDPAAISKIITSGVDAFIGNIYSMENLGRWGSYMDILNFEGEQKILDTILKTFNSFLKIVKDFCDPTTFDPNKITTNRQVLTKLIADMGYAIDRFKDEKYEKFANRLTESAVALSAFDNVLKKEAQTRNKNLKELADQFKAIADQLLKANNSFKNFNSAVKNLQSMDSAKVKENLKAISDGLSTIKQASEASTPVVAGVSNKDNNLLQSSFETALKSALDGVRLRGWHYPSKNWSFSNTEAERMEFEFESAGNGWSDEFK